ncbi:lysozyme [Lonepinella sp. MS14436]|uniref:lysozyme n=1 Tax=Lonepinella sp. MS14436 TaxID=3003619 RepID=UPI0036DB815A
MSKLQKTAIVCSVMSVIGVVLSNYGDHMRTTKAGLEIIGNAEGCRRDPYYCPARVLTVGIGSTEASGEKIEPNKRYTDKEIADRWAKDILNAEQCVNRYGNGSQMPQGAFESMVSITFNVGCSKMQSSTLFRLANQGYSAKMCDEFRKWVYAGGKKLNGLVTRREKERELCLRGGK